MLASSGSIPNWPSAVFYSILAVAVIAGACFCFWAFTKYMMND